MINANRRKIDNMKVVLAGAFGKLGTDILISLVNHGHDVVAADLRDKEGEEVKGKCWRSDSPAHAQHRRYRRYDKLNGGAGRR